jgi:hypothetical protein
MPCLPCGVHCESKSCNDKTQFENNIQELLQ